ANFEQRILNQSGLVTIAPSNVDTINARFAALGFQGPRLSTGLYSNPVHNSNFLGKVDHRFSVRDEFALRYSLYDVHSETAGGGGGLNALGATAGFDITEHTVAASNILTLSPRTVNETRGQFTYSNLHALPTDLTGPAVSIASVATFGT